MTIDNNPSNGAIRDMLQNKLESGADCSIAHKGKKIEISVEDSGRTYKVLLKGDIIKGLNAASHKYMILTIARGYIREGNKVEVDKKPIYSKKLPEHEGGDLTLDKSIKQAALLIAPEEKEGKTPEAVSVKVHVDNSVRVRVGDSLKNFLHKLLGKRVDSKIGSETVKTMIGGEKMTINLNSLYQELGVTDKGPKKQLKLLLDGLASAKLSQQDRHETEDYIMGLFSEYLHAKKTT